MSPQLHYGHPAQLRCQHRRHATNTGLTEQSPFVAQHFTEPRRHDYPVLLHSCCLRGVVGSDIARGISPAPASVAWQCIAEWNRAPCTLAMVDLVFSFAYFSQCRTQHLSEKGDFSPWKSAWDSFLFILLSILGENVHLVAFFHAT